MFKTEAHIHTKEASKCGTIEARRVVELYSELGFDTLFITNHINAPSLAMHGECDWEERIDRYLAPYEEARRAGESLGVTVLLGTEICFKKPEGNCNDYLVYGIDRDFLVGMPDLNSGSLEEFLPYARERGAFIVQAHPYRGGACYPTPELVDGVEVFNAHPRHTNYNERALALAKERGLCMTVGSDVHMECDAGRAYFLTEERIESADQFIDVVKSGRAKFVTAE